MALPSYRFVGIAISAVCLVTTAGNAQDAASPDPARLAGARQFLEASGGVETMIAAMRATLPAKRMANPQIPAEFWTRFEARIVQDAPQLADSIAVLYARTFTADELQALVAFYRSPVGSRFRQVQPTLTTQSAAIGGRWGMRIGVEIGASLHQK